MSLTLNSTGVVIVDDRDASVTYQGTWILGGVHAEYNSTTHGTNASGSTATFIFSGTSIAVYGTFGPEGTPATTYSLDGASLVTVMAPLVRAPIHQTLFYQSPNLQDEEHHLVITFVNGSGIYWLDYFLYMPSQANSVSISAPLSSSQTSIPISSVQPSKPLPSTGTASSSVGMTRPKEIAIVGGVLGGILGAVLLIAGILAVLYFKRRRVLAIPVETRSRHSQPSMGVDPYPFSHPRYLPEPQYDHPSRRTVLSRATSVGSTARPSRSPQLSSLSDFYLTEDLSPGQPGLPYLHRDLGADQSISTLLS